MEKTSEYEGGNRDKYGPSVFFVVVDRISLQSEHVNHVQIEASLDEYSQEVVPHEITLQAFLLVLKVLDHLASHVVEKHRYQKHRNTKNCQK